MTTPDAAPASASVLTPTADPALLAWFGDTAFPDGAAGDAAPALSQAAWEAVYLRLLAAARAPGVLQPLFVFEAPLAGIRPDAPVPIAVLDFPVAAADRATARRAALRAFGGGGAPDPAELAIGAMPTRAFAAAALMHPQWGHDVAVHRGRDVTYALDERFWLSLAGAPRPDTLTLDPGDGGGPRPTSLGAQITAAYPAHVDEATVTLRATYGDATRTARFTLPIGGPPAAPAPDDVWPLVADAGDGTSVTGRASIYRAAGHGDVVNPVVMCEGFPGGYAADYMYDMLNQGALADTLRARGQDVIVVSYDAGAGPIQRNARVLVECLTQVRQRTTAPAVVGGVSMGGLVSRYALAWMESRGIEHGVRDFLTIDTPHGGAYTPIADQWAAKFLAPASPLAATLSMVLDTPANQQFVMRWLSGGRVAPSPLRAQFLADLRAVGDWPRLPRRLAVASGHGRGVDEAAAHPGHREAVSLDGAPFAELRLYTLPGAGQTAVVAEGRGALVASGLPNRLSVTSDFAWEDVPGGTNDYNAQAAGIARALACGPVRCDVPRCCTVPTVSALALDQDPRSPVPPPSSGRSPFHDYVCAEQNEPHVTITPAVAAWILDRLGSPGEPDMASTTKPDATTSYTSAPTTTTPAPAPAPAIDPATVNLHAPSYSADPYPTYAALRRSAPVVKLQPYGSYWVFRHADVVAALNDTATFVKNPPGGTKPLPFVVGALDALPKGVFSADPPFHTAIRGVVEPPIRAAFAQAPQIAGAIADGIIEKIRASRTRRLELMSAYATQVPSATLFTILGLPQTHWPQLVGMVTAIAASNDITQSAGVQMMGGTAAMAMYAYAQSVVRAAAASSDDSLLKTMVDSATAAGLGQVEVQTSLVNFIVAGYLSTTFLIGSGILNLLENPAQLARLRADPSLIDAAVAEMLRHDSPAQVVDRIAATDTTLGGVALPAGTHVTLVLGSANRDETVFANPDAFEIGRAGYAAAVPFGAGIHHCIGAPLVRIVAPLAIGRLVAAFPNLARAGTVQWQTDPYLRAPASLPLAI